MSQFVILRIVGIGSESDAYVAAQAIPLVLTAVVSASLQSLWLPRFARASADRAKWGAELASAQGQTLRTLGTMTLALWVSTSWWTALAFPGLSERQADVVVELVGPLLIACLLSSQSGILTAAMRARGTFVRAEAVAFAGTVLAIVFLIFLVPHYGVHAAVWVGLGRAAAIYGLHLALAGFPHVSLWTDSASSTVWRQAYGLLGSSALVKSSPLVDRYWSSQAGNGAMTALHLAQLGVTSLTTILERALLVPVMPEFARRVRDNDIAGLQALYTRCLKLVALGLCGLTVGLFAIYPFWSGGLMHVLRIARPAAGELFLLTALLLPSVCAIAGSAGAAVFYAFGETKLPTAIGASGFLLSIPLKGLLFDRFGIAGIAAASAVCVVGVVLAFHLAVTLRLRRARLDSDS